MYENASSPSTIVINRISLPGFYVALYEIFAARASGVFMWAFEKRILIEWIMGVLIRQG